MYQRPEIRRENLIDCLGIMSCLEFDWIGKYSGDIFMNYHVQITEVTLKKLFWLNLSG